MEPCGNFHVLFLGGCGRLQDKYARRVRQRPPAFDEGMNVARDGIGELLGPEVRRGGQDHDIDAGIDRLAISVEANKATLRRDVDHGSLRFRSLAVVACINAFL